MSSSGLSPGQVKVSQVRLSPYPLPILLTRLTQTLAFLYSGSVH